MVISDYVNVKNYVDVSGWDWNWWVDFEGWESGDSLIRAKFGKIITVNRSDSVDAVKFVCPLVKFWNKVQTESI